MRLPQSYALHRGVIAPRFAVLAGVVACGVALVFLTPDRDQLFLRHMEDGNAGAAALAMRERSAGPGSAEATTSLIVSQTVRLCAEEGWKGKSVSTLTAYLLNT